MQSTWYSLSDFNRAWNFSKDFRKISNFVKNCPVEAELFDAARQTDMTKLTPAFANAPANACNKWKDAGLDVLQAANI